MPYASQLWASTDSISSFMSVGAGLIAVFAIRGYKLNGVCVIDI
jgi:hypothetical protein